MGDLPCGEGKINYLNGTALEWGVIKSAYFTLSGYNSQFL